MIVEIRRRQFAADQTRLALVQELKEIRQFGLRVSGGDEHGIIDAHRIGDSFRRQQIDPPGDQRTARLRLLLAPAQGGGIGLLKTLDQRRVGKHLPHRHDPRLWNARLTPQKTPPFLLHIDTAV